MPVHSLALLVGSETAGNWNEDQHGCDLMSASTQVSNAAYASFAATGGGTLLSSQPLSTAHTSFTTAGHDVIRRSVHEEKVQARMSPEVARGLLFAHKGADPIDTRYTTSYASSFNAGTGRTLENPLQRTVQKMREARGDQGQESEGAREQSRARTYRTSSSDAFNAANTVMALPIDPAAMKHTIGGGSVAGAGQLSHSLDANYRKIGLRKD